MKRHICKYKNILTVSVIPGWSTEQNKTFIITTCLQSSTHNTQHNILQLTSSSPHLHPCTVFWSHPGSRWAGWMSRGQSQDMSRPHAHQQWCWLYAGHHCWQSSRTVHINIPLWNLSQVIPPPQSSFIKLHIHFISREGNHCNSPLQSLLSKEVSLLKGAYVLLLLGVGLLYRHFHLQHRPGSQYNKFSNTSVTQLVWMLHHSPVLCWWWRMYLHEHPA